MKITQRDKVLLLLLLALIVVAIVIVLPEVGILGCNEKTKTFAAQEKDLDKTISEKLEELYVLGVDADVAENSSASMNRLEENILDLQMEAARLAGSIMAYAKPYAVDKSWVEGLEYRYGVKSDENELIVEYSPILDVDSTDNGNNKTFRLGENEYELPTATREIRYTTTETAECSYLTEFVLDEYDIMKMGATILFLHNIAAKGSILINDVIYETKEERPHTVNFTLLMPPEGSNISEYATIVAEKLREREEEEE